MLKKIAFCLLAICITLPTFANRFNTQLEELAVKVNETIKVWEIRNTSDSSIVVCKKAQKTENTIKQKGTIIAANKSMPFSNILTDPQVDAIYGKTPKNQDGSTPNVDRSFNIKKGSNCDSDNNLCTVTVTLDFAHRSAHWISDTKDHCRIDDKTLLVK
ncbi:MAG: hypothetical protein AAGA27_05695 [Pseudomonadota bacterium]